jgi:hypothetical protein
VDSMKFSVFRPVDREETHPHACTEGVVYLTYTAYDEEVGDEVERIEVVPCRRCAEGRAKWSPSSSLYSPSRASSP